jgi:hypothetical protein
VGLVPFGTGRTSQFRREDVAPVDQGARAQADIEAAFATTRHPYVRIEPVGMARSRPTSDRPSGNPTRPQVAFLAQFIAQERLGDGLELDKAADGTRAYRRAETPLVEIRAGATIDVAA